MEPGTAPYCCCSDISFMVTEGSPVVSFTESRFEYEHTDDCESTTYLLFKDRPVFAVPSY